MSKKQKQILTLAVVGAGVYYVVRQAQARQQTAA